MIQSYLLKCLKLPETIRVECVVNCFVVPTAMTKKGTDQLGHVSANVVGIEHDALEVQEIEL